MIMASISELLLLLLASGANATWDLVSLIDAQEYFKVRDVEVNVQRMMELAGKDAANGKASIAQLLALRWLGEHPSTGKNTKAVREVLEQVAARYKGKDAQGFASEYALRALARLDGKAIPLRRMPESSLRADALAWFPATSTIFGVVDLRTPQGVEGTEDDSLKRLFFAAVPERERKEMYKFADEVGNFRLERVSFAVVPDSADDQRTRLYLRITGRGSRKHLGDYLRKNVGLAEVKQEKDPGGVPLALIDFKGEGPAMGLVGDTDFLIAGFPASRERAKQFQVLQEVLEVRQGKKTRMANSTGPKLFPVFSAT